MTNHQIIEAIEKRRLYYEGRRADRELKDRESKGLHYLDGRIDSLSEVLELLYRETRPKAAEPGSKDIIESLRNVAQYDSHAAAVVKLWDALTEQGNNPSWRVAVATSLLELAQHQKNKHDQAIKAMIKATSPKCYRCKGELTTADGVTACDTCGQIQ